MILNRKRNLNSTSRKSSFVILSVLLCLHTFYVSKAEENAKIIISISDYQSLRPDSLKSSDSIPEDRKHLLEIINDTTENGTLKKENMNDGGRVISPQSGEMRNPNRNLKSLPSKDSVIMRRDTSVTFGDSKKEPPLILIDGVKAATGELHKLLPERIKSLSILKEPKSIEPYGEEGKNGVVIITTKPVE